jgi:hypothetical protein
LTTKFPIFRTQPSGQVPSSLNRVETWTELVPSDGGAPGIGRTKPPWPSAIDDGDAIRCKQRRFYENSTD